MWGLFSALARPVEDVKIREYYSAIFTSSSGQWRGENTATHGMKAVIETKKISYSYKMGECLARLHLTQYHLINIVVKRIELYEDLHFIKRTFDQ